METTHLDEFRRVAELGSFTLAARELHITQSALSKHIAALEREFSVDLFTRDKNGISLTPQGHILYQQSVSLARLLANIHLLLDAESSTELTDDTVSFPPITVTSESSLQSTSSSEAAAFPPAQLSPTAGQAHIPSAAIRKRCHALRSKYDLTTDETCTLILFLEDAGFDSIQHELGVSRDNVADTLVSVYHKLDVTNKSELLQLVISQ